MTKVNVEPPARVDVRYITVDDDQGLSPDRQAMVDAEVSRLEQQVPFIHQLFDPALRVSGNVWFSLTKTALALHTLYRAREITTLGEGIRPDTYDEPLFDGATAREVLLAEKGPDAGQQIMRRHLDFLVTPIEPSPIDGLGSRDFFQGCRDAIAVRQRARVAQELVLEHVLNSGQRSEPMVSASLGCGAAGPVYEMGRRLAAHDVPLSRILLLDNDVMALASARSLANHVGVDADVELLQLDVVRDSLVSRLGPHRLDIVDLLGLFEYIPTEVRRNNTVYRPAESLLRAVGRVVRPGGVIVLANMLACRPQQVFFSQVWPPLYQRSVTATLDIVRGAGYKLSDASVRIPAGNGIYAIFAIRV